jgi:putative membrane protein
MIFGASGVLGLIVLKSGFYSSCLPDLPWVGTIVPRDSLLLPMFAGLFGIPSLILSMGSVQAFDIRVRGNCVYLHRPGAKDVILSLFGGGVVGWMPGMTSGAAATLCVPTIRETARKEDIPSSLRFIWLYSSISASGAVFSLGALFTIMKARSGTMDALEMFLTPENTGWPANLPLMLSLAMAMLTSALIAHSLLRLMDSRMRQVRNIMSSKTVAVAAFMFISALSVGLTGTRGAMILTTSVLLGLLPPLAGVRRIQLMGCLLVPIGATLVAMM